MPVTKSLKLLRVSYGQLTCLVILLMLLQVTFSPPNSGQVMEGFLTLKARVEHGMACSQILREHGVFI